MQASFRFQSSFSWTDILGETFHLAPGPEVTGAGAVGMTGALPVEPAVAGTEFDLDFRPMGVTNGIAYLAIVNLTGQELNMAWGGNWAPHIPTGGRIIWALGSVPNGGQITSLRFMLTQDLTSPGYIRFAVVGS